MLAAPSRPHIGFKQTGSIIYLFVFATNSDLRVEYWISVVCIDTSQHQARWLSRKYAVTRVSGAQLCERQDFAPYPCDGSKRVYCNRL